MSIGDSLGRGTPFGGAVIKEPARFSLEITRGPGSPPQGSTTYVLDAREGNDLSASRACPSCGALNGPANLFCTHCGKPMVAGPTDPSPPTPYPSTTPPGAIPPVALYPYFPSPPPRRANVSSILSGMF